MISDYIIRFLKTLQINNKSIMNECFEHTKEFVEIIKRFYN